MSKHKLRLFNIVELIVIALLLFLIVSPKIAYHVGVGAGFYEALATYPLFLVLVVGVAWAKEKISWEVFKLVALTYAAMILMVTEVFADMMHAPGLNLAAGTLALGFLLAVFFEAIDYLSAIPREGKQDSNRR